MNREQRRASRFKHAQRDTAAFGSYASASTNPLVLLAQASPFPEGLTTAPHIKTREAFGRLMHGGADQGDYDRVAMAINVAKVRAMDIDEPLADMLERAQDAMTACGARHARCGRFGFDGPGLQVMVEAMSAHEVITDASSWQQMEMARSTVEASLAMAAFDNQVHGRAEFPLTPSLVSPSTTTERTA